MTNDVSFELVWEPTPMHTECGHYHWSGVKCPNTRTCNERCCADKVIPIEFD